MFMAKSKVQVVIDRVNYSLVTDESPDSVKEAALRVHEALEMIADAGVEDHYKAAVLAALQFSTALVKNEQEQNERKKREKDLLEKIEERTHSFFLAS